MNVLEDKKILREIQQEVRKLAISYLRFEDAEDVVQETMVKGILNISRLRDSRKIKAWFKAIARNECFKLIGKKSRYYNFLTSYQPDHSLPSGIENERYNQILNRIYKMESKYKDIVQMKYFQNFSVEDISRILKIPEGTVKSRLFKAREILKIRETEVKEKIQNVEVYITPTWKKGSLLLNGDGTWLESVMEVGEVEEWDRYEYGESQLVFWDYRARSEVTRKIETAGLTLLEVMTKFDKTNTMNDRIVYFYLDNDNIYAFQRIFLDKLEEIEFFPDNFIVRNRKIKTGEYADKKIDIVEISINGKEYKNCFREISFDNDYHGQELIESVWTDYGRQLISRLYIGENWKMRGISWKNLENSIQLIYKNIPFRLWSEFVLNKNYCLEDHIL